ncbi:hypothetical protein BFP76_08940 [Amylibacter kogurei]|uniref:HTH lysR-type domain-containing protein n=1 Tax=Paramylibacter kogurei TaxID=1889778 RepID=A0A2G5K0S0_9RHOB|nr:LysR family transcriptional regulator [Amylibacter kogurei]PIB23136.1 hypothetical protein BFP76_08940 [Amylibacter kogurei]
MSNLESLRIDFAALRTLRMVFDHGSFSAAAEMMNVNQSTVSYTIDRLRKAFNDPLFVRQGRGITPTDRCRHIAASSARMLDEFATLSEPSAFDPQTATATISISSNYYERTIILPKLMAAMRKEAPFLRLKMIQSLSEGDQHLRRGECDILLSPVNYTASEFFKRTLIPDHYVCVMDANNPLADIKLSEQEYVAAKHMTVIYGGNWRSRYMIDLEAKGLSLNTIVSLPTPEDLSSLLRNSDLISTVPNRIAQTLSDGIVTRDCPFPAPLSVDMYWTSRTHHSMMYKWIRQLISRIVGEIIRPTNDIKKPAGNI